MRVQKHLGNGIVPFIDVSSYWYISLRVPSIFALYKNIAKLFLNVANARNSANKNFLKIHILFNYTNAYSPRTVKRSVGTE